MTASVLLLYSLWELMKWLEDISTDVLYTVGQDANGEQGMRSFCIYDIKGQVCKGGLRTLSKL